jgi:hypothetical protein
MWQNEAARIPSSKATWVISHQPIFFCFFLYFMTPRHRNSWTLNRSTKQWVSQQLCLLWKNRITQWSVFWFQEPAKVLREALRSGAVHLKDRLTIKLENDMRYGEVRVDHWLMHAKVSCSLFGKLINLTLKHFWFTYYGYVFFIGCWSSNHSWILKVNRQQELL